MANDESGVGRGIMGGNLMSSRSLFASILVACLLAVGSLGSAPVASAASAGQLFLKPGESAKNNVIEIKSRGRGVRIHLPLGPSYIYYDYPYYSSRGYYPTHIGGYVYYPYYYSRSFYPRYGGRCSDGHRSCVANWGHNRGPGSTRLLRARSFGACPCP